MRRPGFRLSGWPFVGWCSLVLLLLFALVLATNGTAEAGIRAVVRRSAQTSVLLFSSAFMASSLRQLYPHAVSRWMLANRRYLGVSFAVSHLIHLFALLALARVSAEFVRNVNAVTLVGGGIGYLFIAAMAATSFDRTAAWLGPRAWSRLHTIGAYYIWFIFLQSYVPRAIVSVAYVPLAALLLIAIGLRMAARLQTRRARRRLEGFSTTESDGMPHAHESQTNQPRQRG
jgi:sulfoxide reductase heme-binding subunit YedZ